MNETETAPPELSAAPMPSDSGSVPDALDVMAETLKVVVQQVNQMAKLQQTTIAELQATIARLNETNEALLAGVELSEKVVNEQDQQVESLGLAVAALAQVEQRLTSLAKAKR